MSLRFIYGRSGSGKTYFCLNEIKSRIKENAARPLILLVPEQFTFQAERNLISVLGTGGILKTEVLSFRRLAFRIFNEAGGITYPHIHPAGKCMVLYRILDKMKDSLQVLSKPAKGQGFVNTLSILITEFKRYNITPEVLESVCNGIKQDDFLKAKIAELNLIYSAFEKTIKERYRDADDDITVASEKMGSVSLYDGAEIWIDGFDGFTPQEYKMIACLLQKAERVNITLCTDCLEEEGFYGGVDIFSPVKNTYKKILNIAREMGIPREPVVHMDEKPLFRFSKSRELSHLESFLYSYPYKKYEEKTKDICLFSSSNIFLEVEAAARDIIRLCREKNMRYRDIAVVTGNLNEYQKLVEVIFTEYGIPYFIDAKVEITNHPLVRLILSMLDIFIENWSYESVFRYLKTGMTGIAQERIDQLENYVLACGIKGSQWTDEQEWKMKPGLVPDEKRPEEQEEMLKAINETRALVVSPLLKFRQKTKGRKKASEFCESLYDFLCELEVSEKIEKSIDAFKKSGNLNLANEYSQVWNIVMELFDQIVEVMGDETFGIERFTNVLKIGINEYKIGLIPASLDQVLVGNLERSKSHEVKALLILGANDGVFPSAKLEEGILSDQDRAILAGAGVELASDTKTKAFDEQYLVYRALTTAGNYLRISWPIANSEGGTCYPSMVISRLRKIFPNITETSNIISTGSPDEDMELISCKTPSFKHMITALRQKADGKEINTLWQEVYHWYSQQEEWKQKCSLVRSAFQYKNIAQPVSRNKIAALYGSPVILSVSRLEKYTSCPFAYYVQYGLGAKERKIYRLTPPDVGTFIHMAIESFSRLVSEENISWRDFDREWCEEKVSQIVEEMLRRMQGSAIVASKRYTVLTKRLKRVITRAVWLIAEHIRRSSFEPVEYEVGFGDEGKYPPIIIELDSGEQIKLTGRIDRVDALETESGTYLRIVDYKSGSKDFKLSDVFYGLQVQLVTYLDALWGEEKEKYLPGGMFYFKVDDPIVKADGRITEKEVEQAIMRQLKMRGLLLADVKLIREMDKTIEKNSLIIPATIKKDGSLGKNSSVATMEQFKLLRGYVRKLLKDLCTEIMKGNVSIQPYKKDDINSCEYCNFLPICQFDTIMKENSFKILNDKNDDEVWELMQERGEGNA
ncbi:MAG: helicase-exonuclease AddAB subunit AddB [Clostridiaceae bacterium]|nr:helicase-exonuclease AddAB subunit AddB [Clostridiaceae bacterium]